MAVPPEKQLELYNAALRLCKERKIAALTVNEKSRHLLDDVWNEHRGALDHCLRQGLWNFATRTIRIEYDASITQEFGYSYAFAKQDDWVRTVEMSSDELFNNPLIDVQDEQGYWFANVEPIYVRQVSNRDDYGGNPSLWPQTFFDYFAAYLASQIVWPLTQSNEIKDQVEDLHRKRLVDGRSKDCMDEATRFVAMGGWPRSRRGRRSSGWDGGRRGQLIG